MADRRFLPSIDNILQCCCRLASDAKICGCPLLDIVACAVGDSEAFFRPGFTHRWCERNGIFGCFTEPTWHIQAALYGHSPGQSDLHVWIVAVTAVFCVIAVAIPSCALWLRRRGKQPLPGILMRIPGLAGLLNTFGDAPGYLLQSSGLFIKTTLLQGTILLLDAYTLNVMLYAIGQDASILVVFPCFIVASMVATLGPVPLGLGTFEATCVAMLSVLGAKVEVALMATLLLRGFTLWLPMIPGLWLAKRELH